MARKFLISLVVFGALLGLYIPSPVGAALVTIDSIVVTAGGVVIPNAPWTFGIPLPAPGNQAVLSQVTPVGGANYDTSETGTHGPTGNPGVPLALCPPLQCPDTTITIGYHIGGNAPNSSTAIFVNPGGSAPGVCAAGQAILLGSCREELAEQPTQNVSEFENWTAVPTTNGNTDLLLFLGYADNSHTTTTGTGGLPDNLTSGDPSGGGFGGTVVSRQANGDPGSAAFNCSTLAVGCWDAGALEIINITRTVPEPGSLLLLGSGLIGLGLAVARRRPQ